MQKSYVIVVFKNEELDCVVGPFLEYDKAVDAADALPESCEWTLTELKQP